MTPEIDQTTASSLLDVQKNHVNEYRSGMERETVGFLRDAVLSCAEIDRLIDCAPDWRKLFFNQAETLMTFRISLVGIVGRAHVSEFTSRISEVFYQTASD